MSSFSHYLACEGKDAYTCGSRSPGRWFAANEVKLILAQIVLVYDIKLGGDGKRAVAPTFGSTVLPPRGHVFFRKRQVASES